MKPYRARNDRQLLQFHWWSYDVPYYMDALNHLQDMKSDGKIRHVGLTNFDTKHLQYVTDKGVQIASNQVSLHAQPLPPLPGCAPIVEPPTLGCPSCVLR